MVWHKPGNVACKCCPHSHRQADQIELLLGALRDIAGLSGLDDKLLEQAGAAIVARIGSIHQIAGSVLHG